MDINWIYLLGLGDGDILLYGYMQYAHNLHDYPDGGFCVFTTVDIC